MAVGEREGGMKEWTGDAHIKDREKERGGRRGREEPERKNKKSPAEETRHRANLEK